MGSPADHPTVHPVVHPVVRWPVVVIRKRTTARGEVRYDVRLRRPDRSTYGRTFRTRKAAEAWEREQLAKRDRGEWIDPSAGRALVEHVAGEWLAQPGRRAKTVSEYRRKLDRWVLPELGGMPVAAVTPADVQRVVNRMVDAGAAANTVRNTYAAVRAMFNHAVRSELIGRNPCRGVDLPSPPPPAGRALSPAEVAKLADAIDERYRALVWVGALLSLRFGELAGLQVGDVDLEAGTLTVARGVSEVAGRVVIEAPKTSAGHRTLAIPGRLVEELRGHVEGRDSGEWLFPSPGGGLLRYANWRRRVWNPAAKRAGLEGVTPHDLRRTAATLMVTSGVDPRTAQHRLGHSDLRMTLGVYSRVREEADRAAAEALEGLFSGRWRHAGDMEPDDPEGV